MYEKCGEESKFFCHQVLLLCFRPSLDGRLTWGTLDCLVCSLLPPLPPSSPPSLSLPSLPLFFLSSSLSSVLEAAEVFFLDFFFAPSSSPPLEEAEELPSPEGRKKELENRASKIFYFADAFEKTTGKYRTYEHIFGGEIPYLVAAAVVASSLLVSLSICPCPPLGAEETFLRTRERCLTPIGTISGCRDISESTALEKKRREFPN